MALNVKFLKGTQTAYDAIDTKDEYSFYYITDSQDLYLGDIKLSSATDLAAAITRLEAVEETADKVENAVVSISAEQSDDKTGTVLTFTDAQGGTETITIADLFLSGAVYDEDTHILSLTVAGQSTPVEVDLEALVPKAVVADEVALANNIIATVDAGNISQGDVIDISDIDSVQALFEAILSQDINPTTTLPSVTSSGLVRPSTYEEGESITYTFNLPTYTVGSYSDSYYGTQETGVEVTSYEAVVFLNGSRNWVKTGTDLGDFSFTSDPITLSHSDYTSSRIYLYYSDGNIPTTYLGKEYPDGQITAGNMYQSTSSITAYLPAFYGTLTTKDDAIDSALVRSLTNSKASVTSGKTYTITVPSGAMRVIFAYRYALGELSSITSAEQFGSEIKDSFDIYTINVYDAGGVNTNSYYVYVKDLANAQETATTYTVTI